MTTITAHTERDGSAHVSIDGAPHQKINGIDLDDARAQVLTVATAHAAKIGAPVTIHAVDPDGEFRAQIHPDGQVQPHAPADPVQDTPFLASVFPQGAAPAAVPPAHRSAALGPASSPTPKRRAATRAEERPSAMPNRVGERPSFITVGRSVQPAEQRWQGALNKIGFRLAPGAKEISYRDDVTAVAQHWPGLRTIAVANPKGSGNKTPTSICLAAQFALIGGAGVLAWDNNETRGSLPWRVDHTAHEATILDLLPRVEALLSGDAQFYAEVGHYVHHQTADKFDALFSDQSVDGAHVVTAQDVEDVYRVAARYYRLAIVDSGNSERADNWLAMIDKADRLVVPCTNVEDTAEAAARMLESLASRDERSARLVREAVVVVSQRNSGRDPNMARIVGQFEAMGHQVVTIPHDPALVTGVIRHGQLRKATQRAWLSAAAAVARGL